VLRTLPDRQTALSVAGTDAYAVDCIVYLQFSSDVMADVEVTANVDDKSYPVSASSLLIVVGEAWSNQHRHLIVERLTHGWYTAGPLLCKRPEHLEFRPPVSK